MLISGHFVCKLDDGTEKRVDAQEFYEWAFRGEGRNYPAVTRSQQLGCFLGVKVASSALVSVTHVK